MQILGISNLVTPRKNEIHRKNNFTPIFGLKMTKTLSQDTVSFSATKKTLTSRANGVSKQTAKEIHAVACELQPEIEKFIKGIFKDFMITAEKPNNLIEKIKGRPKSPDSIVEKSATREWGTKAEIFTNMTDLNGMKIVLREGSKKTVKRILDRFSQAIDSGFLILSEVENKRPIAAKKLKGKKAEQWDYASAEDLENFVKKAQDITVKEIKFDSVDYTPANYSAIHFLFRLPGQKRVFELQLMGHNVAAFKDFDDLLFKILNNKNVDAKYKPLVNMIKPITVTPEESNLLEYVKVKERFDSMNFSEKEANLIRQRINGERNLSAKNDTKDFVEKVKKLNLSDEEKDLFKEEEKYIEDASNKDKLTALKKKASQLNIFQKYRAKAFLFQREKKTVQTSEDAIEYFLPLTDDLSPEYDLNHLYKIYLDCKKAKVSN